jgi:hypothetical protein
VTRTAASEPSNQAPRAADGPGAAAAGHSDSGGWHSGC